MREAGVGRVLVASLHQAIADIRPERLAFYENWLNDGLREGTMNLAPFFAVLSFLRQEGEAYQVITARAGDYAAEWTVQALAPTHRAFMSSSPEWLRQRLVLRLARRVVQLTYPDSRVNSRLQGPTADVELAASIFCTVRERVRQPLCGFYASAITRLFRIFDLGGRTEVVVCRGIGDGSCVLRVALVGQDLDVEPAAADHAMEATERRGLIA